MIGNFNRGKRFGLGLSMAFMVAALPVSTIKAQYVQDVIRMSQAERGSTARFKAMGNAQTALGGDLSSLSGNPAGLGFYNRSDASISLDFLGDVNKGAFFGQETTHNLNKMGISQAGAVFNFPTYRSPGSNLEEGWLNVNMGLGYFKTNDFNTTLSYSGINPSSTFVHFLADQRDLSDTQLEGQYGWEAFLLDYNGSNPNNVYHYPATLEGDNSQRNVLTERGWQSSFDMSLGANYSNKLYLGFALGIPSFRYTGKQTFTEAGYMKSYDDIYRENPNSDFLQSDHEAFQLLEADYELEYNYKQTTRGTGVNGTLGLIYKPSPTVNIGISATTPTWYWVTDEGTTFFDTWYYEPQASNPFFTYNSDEAEDYLEYVVRTPYRINGGVATVFPGYGLISADIEYMDYSSMRFSSSDQLGNAAKTALDEDMNRAIKNTFTSAVNFRIGAEYLFGEQIVGRVGYAHKGTPYKDSDLKSEIISAGLGYRMGNTYLDLTYQNQKQSYTHRPYEIDTNWWSEASNPDAMVKHYRHQVMLTLGFKF